MYRELSRRAGTENEPIRKIDGGNDRLRRAFADRLVERLKYGCAVHRIEHEAHGVRVFVRTGQSVESAVVNGSVGSEDDPAPGASHATTLKRSDSAVTWRRQHRESQRNP